MNACVFLAVPRVGLQCWIVAFLSRTHICFVSAVFRCFDEYLKQTTEKTQGTKEKRNTSPKPGKSNSSHSGPALKGATLEMIKKDEEKKKKEEKDKLKKQQKEERKQQWQKEQAQKEKEQAEKAKQAEKNPYSVFAEKDDEVVCMEEESVVFTDSSSSDHLPKGTLPRLPVTK